MRLHYWIHHTGDYDGATGVQRVVRNLAAGLVDHGHDVVPVRWSADLEAVVGCDRSWTDGLARHGGPALDPSPEPGVPLHLTSTSHLLDGEWLVVPEVPHVAGDDAPNLAVALDYARFHGLRTAVVFYDLIPLRQPGYDELRERHGQYAEALRAADLVLPISRHSAADLLRWWDEGDPDPVGRPTVRAVPLPEQVVGESRVVAPPEPAEGPVVLVTVGTVEPRKNQLATMRAFDALVRRRPDLDLRLDVVGGLHHRVEEEARRLADEQPRIVLHGYLPDDEVRRRVRQAHATVFVSLDEGYGLPVAESLWLGTPCLCSDHGSMAEIAGAGGCLTVPSSDPEAVEAGLERLASDAGLRRRLAEEARSRPLATWRDYAAEVLSALRTHPPADRVVVLEGTAGSPLAEQLAESGATVTRLHWKAASGALLPGGQRSPEAHRSGGGQLAGRWALFPEASAADEAEVRAVLRAARGLGLRVALQVASGRADHLDDADLLLFEDDAAREACLAELLRERDKTLGLRRRLRTGTGTAALEVLRQHGPRTARAGGPRVPARVYYWVGLTVTQPFNTGVQRVTRLLAAALERAGTEVVPVRWDDEAGRMAPVTQEQADHLARWSGPPARRPRTLPEDLSGEWLLLPEITVPVVPPGRDVPSLARSLGMRTAAVFYDLIPAKMPDLYPPAAHEELTRYWRAFADVDVALPISWTMAADLHRWLGDQGLRTPAVVPVPLAGEAASTPRVVAAAAPRPEDPLELLAVGTWEPRKNYPRLLRALREAQRRATRPLRLTIAGRRAGFDELDREVEQLAAETGAVLHGHVTDEDLVALHAASAATVFASWEEGFGLPVLESLWQGRPCVAHDGSAMAEVAPGGGVLLVDVLDEEALADALVRLADEDGLLQRLTAEAVRRPVRTWDEYADDVRRALARSAGSPGWPLPAVVRNRPLLTCAITTYNRAPWLGHSLERLLEATRPWRDVVEVVVCDNASTDATPDVVRRFQGERGFRAHRNAVNVGMLGNLGATARASEGAFVWELGDDDLLVDGALENVLEGLVRHPDVEMAYLNYAYTSFDDPSGLTDAREVVARATPIAEGGANRYVRELREVAGLNENLFTAIYACVFRRDHALRAYQLDTRGAPFSSLLTCVPSSVYALAALQDRPAWWVGEPALVVNMNVSWLRWALLWHLERMPDLFEEAELQGVDPARLDVYRLQHLAAAGEWVRAVYEDAEDQIREGFSLQRLLERSKHLPEFRVRHLPAVRRAYERAWAAGRVVADPVPPEELFARYGL